MARRISVRCVALFLALACLQRLTPSLGEFLVTGPPKLASHVDLLVLLGGGWEFREITSARAFHQGLADRMLLTGMPEARDGRGMPVGQPSYGYLLASGIPKDRIELDGSAMNTWEEVDLIRGRLSPGNTVLIVTDPPHLRRLDWVCRHLLGRSGIAYHLMASTPDWWDASHWWRNRISARFVTLEYLKLAYYALRHPTLFASTQ